MAVDVRLCWEKVLKFGISHKKESLKKIQHDIWFGSDFNIVSSCMFRWARITFRNVLLINIFRSKRNRYLSNETRLIHKSSAGRMHEHKNTHDTSRWNDDFGVGRLFLMVPSHVVCFRDVFGASAHRSRQRSNDLLSIAVHHNTEIAFYMSRKIWKKKHTLAFL